MVARPIFCIRFALFVFVSVCCPGVVRGDASPPVRGRECIRPTEWMRRNHMDFLQERHDLAVRAGREMTDAFASCVACHSSKKFCDRCHTYVGVAPDCFGCHAYPP
ncbi:MAG: sulfur reduction protein DsrJ [Magnetococcales bacterium]|nr:sulfur reduction protein DsrJ [Magnetococcales bacterium]